MEISSLMRYICFDTETTGLRVGDGHKIIEVGMVEIINNEIKREFHRYINPQRKLEKITTEITNITDEMLVDKPLFSEIANDLISFLEDGNLSETFLVAHNAKFDLSFLNYQLEEAILKNLKSFNVIDTIDIVRRKFPGSKLSLDNLCERYNIDLSERKQKGHGALLDAKILADVFLKLISDFDINEITSNKKIEVKIRKRDSILLERNFEISEMDLKFHNESLQKIKASLW